MIEAEGATDAAPWGRSRRSCLQNAECAESAGQGAGAFWGWEPSPWAPWHPRIQAGPLVSTLVSWQGPLPRLALGEAAHGGKAWAAPARLPAWPLAAAHKSCSPVQRPEPQGSSGPLTLSQVRAATKLQL